MKIAMTDKEAALLGSLLQCSTNYLEFGSGGSTYLAAHHVKGQIISVDSSVDWLDAIGKSISNISTGQKPQLILDWVDIGKIREWGYPIGERDKEKWPLYSTQVWKREGAEESDLFLIDGRFRVSCFAETMVRAKIGAHIMIHDFEDRPAYHVALEFARRIAVADQLSVFVKDNQTDLKKAANVAHEYRLSVQ